MICPLCLSANTKTVFTKFHQCLVCDLTFKNSVHHPSIEVERKTYLYHTNSITDQGYLSFLSRLTNHMLPLITADQTGLDFGCGHAPAISHLFKERGIECASYDPFFFPKLELLKVKYDFITCSEVVEHFFNPQQEFKLMISLLKAQGILGIMTNLKPEREGDFEKWWYHIDLTHVVFYSQKTFQWIAKFYNFEVEFLSNNVVLLKSFNSDPILSTTL